MIQRASSSFALFLLAACQSTTGSVLSSQDWRSQMEQSQAELRREVQVLRASLAATESAWFAASNQVDLVSATMPSTLPFTMAAQPADATHQGAILVAADAAASPTLEPLRDALLILEQQHAIHSANIANVSVPGYKRRTLVLSSAIEDPSGSSSPHVNDISVAMHAGVLEFTGNKLDLAIDGEGFFEFQLPNGEVRYTRDGSFRQNAEGRLVTAAGYRLTDDLAIPPNGMDISISEQGDVFALDDTDGALTPIGSIRVHVFPNASGLRPMSGNSFAMTSSSGQNEARLPGRRSCGVIKQGLLERSNVDLTRELIDMQLVDRRATAIRQVLARHGIVTP